ncbi:hypothetical protein KPSA1_01344 [Pseudomonas syringae pv. actinidiae]|uniref:Uncharacterized protein n=1 Tax=Pseudomonas syringae pv. actinidiae TaxID=103796 RepID=A0A2V0QHE0_PSESF|nr:hypothetical protein KPSA1_01344 [Pseudomonas syringae pv. actinidiae]
MFKHTDPGLSVFATHDKACTERADTSFAGVHHKGPGLGIARGFDEDFPAKQLQLAKAWAEVNIHRGGGIEAYLTTIFQAQAFAFAYDSALVCHQ